MIILKKNLDLYLQKVLYHYLLDIDENANGVFNKLHT
jgi:hypothetical protein